MEEFELELGETVVRIVHMHWFSLFLRLIPIGVLAWAPLLVAPLFNYFASTATGAAAHATILTINFQTPLAHFLLGTWWLIMWMAAFTLITCFFLTHWVITSQRIVEITQDTLFGRRVSSFLLSRVQDVTTDTSGLIPTIIGYGTLIIETAGNEEKFSMDNVAHPEAIRDVIMQKIADKENPDDIATRITKSVGGALL